MVHNAIRRNIFLNFIGILILSLASPGQAISAGVTLEQKIGQMLILGFPGRSVNEEWPRHIYKMIRAGEIGGVILFERNISSPKQVKKLNTYFKSASLGLVPFIAIDQEGGKVQRLHEGNGFFHTPSAKNLGTKDPAFASLAYGNMSRQLARSGFNVNFGPVVDLNLNTTNTVLAKKQRSYGRNPDNVIKYAEAFIQAHKNAGVLTVAKHFPGHGSSKADSHKGFTDISKTWVESELKPYAYFAATNSVDMVMVGHLYHPRFSSKPGEPASLSSKAIKQELRKKLKFSGLVISDDMEMRAITKYYGFDESIVRAIAAGNDLIIHSNNIKPDRNIAKRALKAVLKAVKENRISVRQIDQSYQRIMRAKQKISRLATNNSN